MNIDRRKDFPILSQFVRGQQLVYLDSAATTQKPKSVIDAMNRYYLENNANIHRAVHYLSERATYDYEAVRVNVQNFINAADSHEIIFVRGVTEGINLIAQSYGRTYLKAGDEIVITAMEHHSNIVPWQLLCAQMGAILRVIPIKDNGEIDLDSYAGLLTEKTKLISIIHVSNVLGTVNPVKKMIAIAHAQNIPVVLDGAQAIPHLAVDVQDLDCDFYLFSSHKAYGPTGIGVVYGKTRYLEEMPPYQGGGDMIKQVSFAETTYQDLPYKFEAGTPNIAGTIGLGAALDYLRDIGMQNIAAYDQQLLAYATEALSNIPHLKIIGNASHKIAILSFILADIHAHDIGTILDSEGIAVRTGHHCAMPLMERFGLPATVRASFGLYNTREEVDSLVQGLYKANKIFSA